MNNQLIDRLQNFTLDRKILYIDSNDRDINRWPNPCEFEISCPQNYNNVESIRLVNIQTINKCYNISEYLQNNKLICTINGVSNTITLKDGYYNYNQLQNSLQNKLNNINIDNSFVVKYNEVNQKMFFGHSDNSFSLSFHGLVYNNNCINNNYVNIYNQYSKWGLGYILGFNKNNYISIDSSSNNFIQYETSLNNFWINSDNTNYIIEPPNAIDLDENKQIFVEIEKLNKADEIKPFITDKINNTNSGIVNSFFAKIPIILLTENQSINNKECYIEGASYFQPPIDKISKLKIKLRYHNGMLVDLQNKNISLTFEINQIRNEMKDYNVRTPFLQ